MNELWEFLHHWRLVTVASVVLFVLQALALLSVLHALKHVRTSQAAVAWTIGLLTLPFVALPLYWVFARHRFEGYREAIREVGERYQRSVRVVQRELMTAKFASTASRSTAVEYLADILDTPVSRGNAFELLIDGSQFFEAVFDAIDSAERYLYLSFFIIRDDELGRRFAEALLRRAADGVQVRLVYDEVGCIRLPNAYIDRLRAGGIDVRSFNTRQGWVNRFQLNFRNHRKLVVADGTRSIVGGLNIGDEYLGKAAGLNRWRDTGLEVRGPATRKVQAVFAGDYYWAARKDLPEADWQDDGEEDAARDEVSQIDARSTLGYAAVCATGPSDTRPRAAMMFSAAASAARRRLWISTPYLVPDESALVGLHMAKARGVDVRVLIPSEADHWGVYLAGFYYEQIFAEAGIPVFRYQEGFMHQKCVLVDDEMVLIGSHNLDNRSIYLNFEMMLAVEDRELVRQAAAMLQQDFADAYHSNAPDAPPRQWFARAGTAVARLLSPIL